MAVLPEKNLLLGRPKNASEGLPILKDPFKHVVVIGGTGKGKTSQLLNLLDMLDGRVIIISPDGDFAEKAYSAGSTYITKTNPISLNPLTADWLDRNERANILTETLNFASTVATQDKQMPMMVLMQRILRNCVRIGIRNMAELVDFLDYEDKRKGLRDKFWSRFDEKDGRFPKYKEQVDSARRVSARLSWLVDDDNAYQFFKGTNNFRVAHLTGKTIFNLFGLDPFVRSFIGSLVMLYVRSYYLHEATTESEPLYVFVDEANHFIEENLYKIFPECRKYNIGFIISLHTYAQVSKQVEELIEANCHTKIALRDNFQAEIQIGEKSYSAYLYPPPKATPPPKINFLHDGWIEC